MAAPTGGATGVPSGAPPLPDSAVFVSLPSASPTPKAAGPPALPPNPSPAAVLAHYWGYSAFRSCQAEVVDAVLAGRDGLVVMATGAGKSVCYQVPALVRAAAAGQTAVVVSPLISLMQDQVEALQARGVAACYLGSAQADAGVTARAWAGDYAVVYITPESVMAEVGRLQALAGAGKLSLVAIDEAHCVSEWGALCGKGGGGGGRDGERGTRSRALDLHTLPTAPRAPRAPCTPRALGPSPTHT